MKQKQVKASPKPAKKTMVTRKAAAPKKVKEVVQEDDEIVEEEVVPKKAAKAKANKVQKAQKVKKIVVEEPVPEEEEEEEEDDFMEEDNEEYNDGEDQEFDEAGEEDEDDQMENDDFEGDEEEDEDAEGGEEENDDGEGGDEEDDDEEPSETAIEKEEPTIPSKVKSGQIPPTVPLNKIVHVTKLPKKCKQIDIVEIFAKYGAIDQVHIVVTPDGTVANVAFKTEKAATAALAANKKVKLEDNFILVTRKKPRKDKAPEVKEKIDVKDSRERTVYVRYIKRNTTEDQIKEHFESCGEVERVKLVHKNSITFAFVTFSDKDGATAAKKLHNSVLNDTTIGVYDNTVDYSKIGQRDAKLTIMLKNKQQIESLEGAKLESIFSKCGEIDNMDVLCKKNILAFISFKTEDAVKKAFKMNGKTEQEIELEIEEYNPEKKKTSIYISNLPRDCTEDDLTNLFSKAGEISSVIVKRGFAIIHFKDSDAYCKSFLQNESIIRNQMIFIEPHSTRKQSLLKSKLSKGFQNKWGHKRPAQNGNSFFKGKKARYN